jgi:ARG/rhodanese/phosphatase superfamily protein
MRTGLWIGLALTTVAALGAAGLHFATSPAELAEAPVPRDADPEPEAEAPPEGDVVPGTPLGGGASIAEPTIVENLVVFPVYAPKPAADTALVALDQAIASAQAEVHELGEGSVRQLVFENKSDQPIIAVSGLLLGGGRQDRMIVRDFVLEPHQLAEVEVRCGELHRWMTSRRGVDTGGKFTVLPTMVGSWIRGIAEGTGDQRKVWDAVDVMNAANCKSSPTSALAASIEDKALEKPRNALAASVLQYLARLPMQENLVGLAYAVDGNVRDVRVFATAQLFLQHRAVLSRTAAFDALAGRPKAPPIPEVRVEPHSPSEMPLGDQVVSFVSSIRDRPDSVEEVSSSGSTKTRYLHARRGYGAIAMWTPAGREAVPITESFLANDAAVRPQVPATCAVN